MVDEVVSCSQIPAEGQADLRLAGQAPVKSPGPWLGNTPDHNQGRVHMEDLPGRISGSAVSLLFPLVSSSVFPGS